MYVSVISKTLGTCTLLLYCVCMHAASITSHSLSSLPLHDISHWQVEPSQPCTALTVVQTQGLPPPNTWIVWSIFSLLCCC